MKTYGLRDIIGPIMVGPSSSHTAGALALASMARKLFGEQPERAERQQHGDREHRQGGQQRDQGEQEESEQVRRPCAHGGALHALHAHALFPSETQRASQAAQREGDQHPAHRRPPETGKRGNYDGQARHGGEHRQQHGASPKRSRPAR